MLPFLAHILSFQHRAAAGDQSHGITTGMRIDTKKSLLHIGSLYSVVRQFVINDSPDMEGVAVLQCIGQQCIRPALVAQGPYPPLDPVGPHRSEPAVGGGREMSAM